MSYPENPRLSRLVSSITDYSSLMHEYGAQDVQRLLDEAQHSLTTILERIKNLPLDPVLASLEPNEIDAIRSLRVDGPRRLWKTIDEDVYREKLEGAMLARFAACTLGAVVELWTVADMEEWAHYIKDQFPPVDYWSSVKDPSRLRYHKSICQAYTRDGINGVPADDDVTYTILGLLIAEDYGVDFTTEDVGRAWVRYLPIACTAEEAALNNLKKGIPASQAADVDNPFCQWIGADIRSDPWAYMSPAYPEKAAELAYKDAYISHRRNGIYGEMFFSAAQSAAFAVDNAVEALEIGLTEIPEDCTLAKDIRWALKKGKNIRNFRDARQAVDERFSGMNSVHTNNNACLTIFGLMIGENDVSKVIGETVAMGWTTIAPQQQPAVS